MQMSPIVEIQSAYCDMRTEISDVAHAIGPRKVNHPASRPWSDSLTDPDRRIDLIMARSFRLRTSGTDRVRPSPSMVPVRFLLRRVGAVRCQARTTASIELLAQGLMSSVL